VEVQGEVLLKEGIEQQIFGPFSEEGDRTESAFID
jgi:hypothetical protein